MSFDLLRCIHESLHALFNFFRGQFFIKRVDPAVATMDIESCLAVSLVRAGYSHGCDVPRKIYFHECTRMNIH